MDAKKAKRVLAKFKGHAKTLGRGLCKVMYGTITAGLVFLAVYGFISVTGENGWSAVCDFIVACATMAVAMILMYIFGANGRRQAKHG